MIRWPFITRKEHEAKLAEVEARLYDIEKHFVTKRDPETGRVTETLADRHKRGALPPKRVNMNQLCKWLEQTDGGRKVESGQRT